VADDLTGPARDAPALRIRTIVRLRRSRSVGRPHIPWARTRKPRSNSGTRPPRMVHRGPIAPLWRFTSTGLGRDLW
jgi:hypothetical protein